MPEPESYPQAVYEPPPGSTVMVLVRHGQSEAARPDTPFPLVEGHGDPPLSDLGRAQAVRVGQRLARERVDAIVVTSLRRTVQTAEPLARLKGLDPEVERDLREVHLGVWEGGEFRRRVAGRDPLAVRMFTEQRWDVIPGAEAPETLAARVRDAVERLAAAHPDQRVVVVCHGGIVGEILRLATNCEPFAFVGADNASISEVVVRSDRWAVRRYNDISHLGGL